MLHAKNAYDQIQGCCESDGVLTREHVRISRNRFLRMRQVQAGEYLIGRLGSTIAWDTGGGVGSPRHLVDKVQMCSECFINMHGVGKTTYYKHCKKVQCGDISYVPTVSTRRSPKVHHSIICCLLICFNRGWTWLLG